MTNLIGNILSFIFGNHSGLATIIISAFPLVELKGAIPIGMSKDFWGTYALSNIVAFLFALLGSSLIILILPLIFKPILNFLKRTRLFKNIANGIENKINKHSKTILSSKKTTILKWLAIFVFVAIPLPLTGVYTGCCVAVAIGLDYYQTVLSVFLGNVVAGLIIYFVCSIFPNFTTILAYIVLGFVVLIIIISIIKKLIKNRKIPDNK